MTTPDTPTLLANASAGQLLDDAKVANALATQCVIGMREEEREPLLRLAELARAVARMASAADRIAEDTNGSGYVADWFVDADGEVSFGMTQGEPVQSLCAALASTWHTQGEG